MKTFLKVVIGLVAVLVLVIVGGYFALRRADSSYAELETKYATAESKFVRLPSGVRMHYRDRGNPERRVLLLVHGFSESMETWERWVPLLSSEFRVVTLDLPGHGLTQAPDAYPPKLPAFVDTVAEFAEQVGLKKFSLIGNSMGGHIAWLFAVKYPDRIDSLVLVDAGGWATKDMMEGTLDNQPWVFRLIANQTLAPILAKLDPAPLMRSGLKLAYANDALATDQIVTRYSDFLCAPGHRAFIMGIEVSMTPDIFATPEKLAAIRTPTLILWGDKDELIPVGDANKFAQSIQGASVVIYPNVGHVPQEEAAEQSASDLKAFLAKHPEVL